jgi:uncharacterized heparinase superfamily protein
VRYRVELRSREGKYVRVSTYSRTLFGTLNIDVTTGTVTAADITEKEGGGPVHFNMSYARNGTVCSGSERTKETRLNG